MLSSWLVSLLVQSAIVTALVFTPPLLRSLDDALAHHDPAWRICLFLFPLASLVLLESLGVLALATRDLLPRTKAPTAVGVGLTFLGALFAHADTTLFHRFGRHLSDLLRYFKMPHGGEAAGDPLSNALLFTLAVFWSLLSVALLLGTHRLVLVIFARVSRFWLSFSATIALLLLSLVVVSPWVMRSLLPDGLGPRLLASLPIRPEVFGGPAHHRPRDPQLRVLQDALTREYERQFAHVYRPLPTPRLDVDSLTKSPPDIALIIAESLRSTQLTAQNMPRLFAWSQKGLRGVRHYAATNHSESGLFVLLYGQSALRYNTTLDQGAPPTLCVLLQQAGYRCGYYTGHPKKWLRREEFLNERTMNDFVQDDAGSWNDWDRRALDSASRALRSEGRQFTITFLMSSHYEYRYPPEYQKRTPDDPPGTAWLPGQARPEEFEACRNRYQNVTAFLDDLVTDHIETLDPTKTLVIFTGDHGESTGENGRFGHGYDFSDPLTQVPFVVVGPGIEPEVRTELSSHLDVLPTVLHALGVETGTGRLGRALQASPPDPTEPASDRPLFSTYTTVGRPFADALLLDDDLRLRLRLDPTRPHVEVIGFEDARGAPIDPEVSPHRRKQLIDAFTMILLQSGNPLRME